MSRRLRLPTNQTYQHRRSDGDERNRDKTGRQNVSETIHHDKADNPRILRNPKLGEDDNHVPM
jgi:hypothetical protein